MPHKLVKKSDDTVLLKSTVVKPISKEKKSLPRKTTIESKKQKKTSLKVVTNVDKTEHIFIKNSVKKKPEKKEAVIPSSKIVDRNVRVALLSVFRLRMDHAHLISNVARYTGTAFVVVGAFFTLHNLNAVNSYFNESISSQATIVGSTTDCIAGSVDCLGGTGTGSQTTVDTTPDADFNVESQSKIIGNTVPVNVTVPLADSVVLIAKNSATNQMYTMGTMNRVGDIAWRSYWQTPSMPDGTYRLKAVITNIYGTYYFLSADEYSILNYPIEDIVQTTDNTSTSSDQTSTTSTQTLEPVSTASLRLEIDPILKGTEYVRMYIEAASSVKLFIRPKNATVSTFTQLGSANFTGNNEWKYVWDTLKLSNGFYEVRAQGLLLDGKSVLNTVTVEIENIVTETDSATTTTVVNTISLESDENVFEPIIKINIAGSNPLSGAIDVYFDTQNAQYVEVYSVSERALTPHFLGLARKQTETVWKYRLETINIPNGLYSLFAKVRNSYGDNNSSKVPFSVKNSLIVEQTPEQNTYVETLKTVSIEGEVSMSEPLPPPPQLFSKPTLNETDEAVSSPSFETADGNIQNEIALLLKDFGTKANTLMQAYGSAVRSGDESRKDEIKNKMDALENEIISKIPLTSDREDIERRIKEYIESINTEIRERVERSEIIIRERVGDAVTKDSDKDGVSDYDEVSIYRTDPLKGDTDGDGFIDGVEILSGFNPTDETREANIKYESPKDSGLVREDMLTVTSISSLSETNSANENNANPAIISGTGLPNSFVTLYIFSTPIVVTVKTDTQGNWTYIFDKELDDGAHEVYVGITDNAGKIVAKSNPLSFIKTAEAYSPVGEDVGATVITEAVSPALISERMMLVIGSVCVVALGLVLILLGLHARTRTRLLEVE